MSVQPFNVNELAMLKLMLEELSEHQANTGCNDLILPASQELVGFAKEYNKTSEVGLEHDNGNLYGVDLDVTGYFINRVNELLASAE